MSFKQLAAACYENVAALGEAVALLGLDKGIGRGRRESRFHSEVDTSGVW